MKTVATIFTGAGFFEVGAIAAGLTPVWGVEVDASIASVYAGNIGPHVIVERAEGVDYSVLERPDWLHASPVCTNASVAKRDGKEAEEDINTARAVAAAVHALRSEEFSLENVWGYRTFDSFAIILKALHECGYRVNFWHLNSADYGVPQTRRRLILLASLKSRPHRPPATHREGGDMFCAPWVGWYESVEDLIPTLPESKFAEWQLKRLRGFSTQLIGGGNAGDGENGSTSKCPSEPAYTIAADSALRNTRAFLMAGDNTGSNNGRGTIRNSSSPALSVTGSHATHKAFIVQGTSTMELREADEPSACVMATVHKKAARSRAFIAHPSADNDRFVVSPDDEPAFTQTNTAGTTRAWPEQGRVVAMTPRALARFQSIPDWFVLPEKAGLACKVIGNGVPPLLARRMIESRRHGDAL